MRVWRLTRARYANAAFSGDGGLYRDGRWHGRGTRIVYASGSLALAALEVLVHVDPAFVPEHVAVFADIPDDLVMKVLTPTELPANWRAIPPPTGSQRLGAQWLEMSVSPVMRVPSVVVPQEYNFLLNPQHPNFARIELGAPMPFSFDPRLWTTAE